jgi:hypothetical protein
MICQTIPIADAIADHGNYIREHLANNDSDFQNKLDRWLAGETPTDEDGHIALAIDHGEVVGWCRTERWNSGREVYDTLEAFVARDYRTRGIASWCAAGLACNALHDGGHTVAVFAPTMVRVAIRACLSPVRYEWDASIGRWVQP